MKAPDDQPEEALPAPQTPPFHPRAATWAALLGHWTRFARSALALPRDEAGERLRASVGDLIMLQAVTCALGEVESMPAGERSLGIDRAGVLIEKHAAALAARWPEGLPPPIETFVREAQDALSAAERDAASGFEGGS